MTSSKCAFCWQVRKFIKLSLRALHIAKAFLPFLKKIKPKFLNDYISCKTTKDMIAKPCFIHSYISATVPMHVVVLQRWAIFVRLGGAVCSFLNFKRVVWGSLLRLSHGGTWLFRLALHISKPCNHKKQSLKPCCQHFVTKFHHMIWKSRGL